MSQDYKATLHLPATEFPMRGDLPKREPGILSRWEDEGLYARLRDNAQGRPLFVLHDGPPYANGQIDRDDRAASDVHGRTEIRSYPHNDSYRI